MKRKTSLFIMTALFFLIGGCANSEFLSSKNYSCNCIEDKVIIKTLKDEPAYVKYNRLLETATIELVNAELINGHFLAPCDDSLPEKYRIEGTPVSVSGEVIFCTEWNKPYFRIIPYYLINLSTIEKRK